MSSKINLKALFLSLQEEIILKLNRKENHPGAKGNISEFNLIDTFREYLPRRYNVEKSFVVDANGNKSHEIDMVIFDRQYTPLIFNFGGSIYIPAESVYAVLEVKQVLNKSNILYTGKKIESVRKLFRTNGPVYHQEGINKKPRPLFNILSGILTLKSEYTSLYSNQFNRVVASLNNIQQINLGCVLEKGALSFSYNKGSVKISYSSQKTALIMFFINLISSLQKLATVPVIELDKYAKSLKN